jgi:LPXTG-site transpeptidase (sortase) family protein
MKVKRNTHKTSNSSFIIVVLGVILIFVSLGLRLYKLKTLSFFGNGVGENQVAVSSNSPVYIEIDSLGIKLNVVETSIVNGVWEIPENSAGHLNTSSGIGSGNMVIYGHNKNNIFGPIRWIKNDASVILTGTDGKKYNYKVVETKEVFPSDIGYVMEKNEETLTLYTCSGIFDSKRFIIIAKKVI